MHSIGLCTLTVFDKQFTYQGDGACCEGLIHSGLWRFNLLSLDPYREDSLWHMPCTECHLPSCWANPHFSSHSWALQVTCACCLSGCQGHISAGLSWLRSPLGPGLWRAQVLFCAQTSDTLKTWDWNLVYFKNRFFSWHHAAIQSLASSILLPCGTFCSSVFKQFQVLCKHKNHGKQPS